MKRMWKGNPLWVLHTHTHTTRKENRFIVEKLIKMQGFVIGQITLMKLLTEDFILIFSL